MRRPSPSELHLTLTITWAVLLAPTVLWWRDSVFWVALISVYANVASHWSCWEASKAGETAKEVQAENSQGAP